MCFSYFHSEYALGVFSVSSNLPRGSMAPYLFSELQVMEAVQSKNLHLVFKGAIANSLRTIGSKILLWYGFSSNSDYY